MSGYYTTLHELGSHKSFSTSSEALEKLILRVGEDHKERINNYRLFWDFYEGRQWNGQDPNFAGDPRSQTFNYSRRICDIKTQFLVKQGFKIGVPERRDNAGVMEKEQRDFIKRWLDDQWDANERVLWGLEAVQQGLVTGDLFIKVFWVPATGIDPGYVKFEVIPSIWVFPEWQGVGPNRRLNQVLLAYPYPVIKERTISTIFKTTTETYTDWALYEELWTDEFYEIRREDQVVERGENIFGEVPFVHVLNRPNTNGRYGTSELADLVPIQRQINEKATDISDIIDYHGSPQTVVIGAKASADLERGSDNIWSLPQKAEIKNLEILGDLKANLTWFEKILNVMFDIASTPNQIVNPTQNISNTPGVALHLAYMPIIEDRMVKQQVYGRGVRACNRMALKWGEMMDPEFATQFTKLPSPQRYYTEVSWEEPLARDQSQQLENQKSRLQMGITTRKRILMEEDGIGEAEAQKLIEEADEDTKKRLEVTTKIDPKQDAFGKPHRPDPIVQGDKISENATRG